MRPAQLALLFRTALIAIALLLLSAYLVLEAVLWWMPFSPWNHQAELLILAIPALYLLLGLFLRTASIDPGLARFALLARAAFEHAAARVLASRRLALLLAALILFILLAWAPHYLTWPLWTDHDHFLAMARAWDLGRFPWSDLRTYQFPGEVEWAWLIGKLSGWNNPSAFYAADLALWALPILTLLAVRLETGESRAPSALAILSLLGIACSFHHAMAAQRDTHAALCVVTALTWLLAWPQRLAPALGAGSLFACALAIRPQIILLAPATLLAAWPESAHSVPIIPHPRLSRPWLRPAITALSTILATLALFAPIWLPGRFQDFLDALRWPLQQEGMYGEWNLAHAGRVLGRHLANFNTLALLIANAAVAFRGPSPTLKRWARASSLALLGALAYRPLSPVDHHYLQNVLAILQAWSVFPIARALLQSRSLRPISKCTAAALLLWNAFPWFASACDLPASFRSIPSILTRQPPRLPPPGASAAYPASGERIYHYSWQDYLDSLAFIRRHATRQTPVVNFLTHYPYPVLNGATGRPAPLPLESLILLQWYPAVDFDTPLAQALRAAPPGTLVFIDGAHLDRNIRRRLPATLATLADRFHPVARIGEIEIHRRITP